jgi:Zn-dependent protease
MTSSFPFLIFQLIVLIFSVMIHEISHGYVAEKLGDPTARLAGRLTLNPIKHIDVFGSILLPFLLFISGSGVILGWAKPVPYNPFNLHKDMKYGPLKVALAGPASNILLLVVLSIFARLTVGVLSPTIIALFGFIAFLNIYLAIFNLVPIPPLDGSKILPLILPRRYAFNIERFGFAGIFIVFIFVYLFAPIISKIAAWIFFNIAGGQVFVVTSQFLGG